jgi:hypothetical protein
LICSWDFNDTVGPCCEVKAHVGSDIRSLKHGHE